MHTTRQFTASRREPEPPVFAMTRRPRRDRREGMFVILAVTFGAWLLAAFVCVANYSLALPRHGQQPAAKPAAATSTPILPVSENRK